MPKSVLVELLGVEIVSLSKLVPELLLILVSTLGAMLGSVMIVPVLGFGDIPGLGSAKVGVLEFESKLSAVAGPVVVSDVGVKLFSKLVPTEGEVVFSVLLSLIGLVIAVPPIIGLTTSPVPGSASVLTTASEPLIGKLAGVAGLPVIGTGFRPGFEPCLGLSI
jgi:hypothetical protein